MKVATKQIEQSILESEPLPRWVGDLSPKYRFPDEEGSARLVLRCDRRVEVWLAGALRQCVRGLEVVSPPTHRVFLYAVHSTAISRGTEEPVLGFFIPSEDACFHETGQVSLVIATGLSALLHSSGYPDAAQHALHVLGHEYAHYEQWRDGRPCVERGVEKRGRELVRMALEVAW